MKVQLTLPWACLASDNLRKGLDRKLWSRYKTARDAAYAVALMQVRGERPRIPSAHVRMDVRFYPPDKRRRDTGNYVKMLKDALEGVVYADDNQVRVTTERNAGVDRDNPRAEVILEAL